MALARQNFVLQMGQGVDTKTDPKQVLPGKLTELENATFQSTNRLTKRAGSTELAASSHPSSGNAIASFKDQLIVMDGEQIYSYGKQFDNLVSKGAKIAIDVTAESIIKNSYQQTSPDSCLLNGLSAYAWEDSQGGVHYSIFDNVTQQLIVSNVSIAGASVPKVVKLGTSFAIIYIEAGATNYLKAKIIDSANPTGIATDLTLFSNATEITCYDATSHGSDIYYSIGCGSSLYAAKVAAGGSITGPISLSATAFRVATVYGSFGHIYIGYATATDVKCVSLDAAVTTFGTPITIETIANAVNITGIETASDNFTWYYEIPATSPSDHCVRKNTVAVGVAGTAADFNRSVGLWSKPFAYGSSHYVCLVHDSDLQSTYFVFNASGMAVAKIAPSNGGTLSIKGCLREVNQSSSNAFELSYCIKDLVESINGDVYTQTGINSGLMTFQGAVSSESLGNNLNISGGIVSMYDGQGISEQNFNLYPEDVSASIVSLSGGGLKNGSYQYCATYEWTDSQGQIHISAPSVPITVDFENEKRFFTATPIQRTDPSVYVAPYTLAGTNTDNTVFCSTGDIITGPGIPLNAWVVDSLNYAFTNLSTTRLAVPYRQSWIWDNCTSTPGTVTAYSTGTKKTEYTSTTNSNKISVYPVGSNAYRCEFEDNNLYTVVTSAGTFSCYRLKMSENERLVVGDNLELTFAASGSGNYTYDIKKIEYGYVYLGGYTDQFGPSPSPQTLPANYLTIKNCNVFRSIYRPSSSTVGAFNNVVLTFQKDSKPNLFIGQRIVSQYFANYAPNGGAQYAIITSFSFLSDTTVQIYFDKNYQMNSTSSRFYLYLTFTPHWLKAEQTLTCTNGFTSTVKVVSVGVDYLVTVDQVAEANGTGYATTDQINSTQIKIPTLRITSKPSDIPVSIALYRTLSNETLFYRVSKFDNPLLNNKSVDYVFFNDATPDDQLIGNEQLYTTGGVLDNGPAPASNLMVQYKNRLIAVSSEDPFTWYFSKPVGTNIPVQFSPFFYKKIPELGGPITALGVMDDKLIFFKRSSIFIVVGTGPNNLGLQDDFNDAELVTTDTGCLEPKSVVRTPLGLMYKSGKGIYLLNRGLNVQYVGASVEAYNTATVTSSELIENVNQVRFTLNTGVTLVYDYYFEQWSVFTNQNAIDSTIYDSKFTYLRPDGKIYKETPNVWTDGGLPIYMKLRTSWLSFNGLQGLERIYNAMVLGDYKSPHTLTMSVLHDFNSTVTQTTAIPVASSPGVYQFKVYLNRQKTDALQFLLQETQSGPSYGEGLDISSIGLEVGVKKGLNTLPAGKLYG